MKKKPSHGYNPFDPTALADSVSKELSSIRFSGDLKCVHNEKKFLGHFNCEDIYNLIKKVGLLAYLAKRGLDDLQILIDIDEDSVHHLRLFHKDAKPEKLMIDLRLSKSKFFPKKKLAYTEYDNMPYDMVVIEWLAAQDPFGKFTPKRPQLPGQNKPGLGVLEFCFDMMYSVAKIVSKDGFLDVPDHGHGAIMYSKKFRFFDPAHEGVLRAVLRDLSKYSLSDISWGFITETIIDSYKNKPHIYDPSEQIYCVSDRLKKHYKAKEYKSIFHNYYKRKSFYFDYQTMIEKRERILARKKIADL